MSVGEQIIGALKVIGGFAGIIALGWKIFEEMKSYLRIRVEAKKDGGNYTVLTEIENVNKISNKVIENAFLLIMPEQNDLIEAGQNVAEKLKTNHLIESTNDFEYLTSDNIIYIGNKIAFFPLKFYYSENIDIADEKLTYRCFIDKSKFEKGLYSVRFYVYGKKRLHRSTQDLVIIE